MTHDDDAAVFSLAEHAKLAQELLSVHVCRRALVLAICCARACVLTMLCVVGALDGWPGARHVTRNPADVPQISKPHWI
jgi:hypothetical protein